MPLPWDYQLRFQDYGPEDQLDDKLWKCMGILRACDPELVLSYGMVGSNRTAITSKSGLRKARAWLAKWSRRQLDLPPTKMIDLVLGSDTRDYRGSLRMNQAIDGHYYHYYIHLFQKRHDLAALCGDPPLKAAGVFQRMVSAVRPHQAAWRESRNFGLLFSNCYGGLHSSTKVPSDLPCKFPPEAVPYGWLLSDKVNNWYPDGVWWINYWGPEIVAEFGRELMLGLPVPHVEESEDGGFFFWLSDDFFTIDCPEHLRIQRQALEHLRFREHQLRWIERQERGEHPWGTH